MLIVLICSPKSITLCCSHCPGTGLLSLIFFSGVCVSHLSTTSGYSHRPALERISLGAIPNTYSSASNTSLFVPKCRRTVYHLSSRLYTATTSTLALSSRGPSVQTTRSRCSPFLSSPSWLSLMMTSLLSRGCFCIHVLSTSWPYPTILLTVFLPILSPKVLPAGLIPAQPTLVSSSDASCLDMHAPL